MAAYHDPDIFFDPVGKPTIATGTVKNGDMPEASYLLDADAWQAQLIYGGPCNVSIAIDDLQTSYREIVFREPGFTDRALFGVVATGSGTVSIQLTSGGTEYTIDVSNGFEDSVDDAALGNASAFWQSSDQPFALAASDELPGSPHFQLKKSAGTVRVFAIMVQWGRADAAL
tara:strand:- start:2207 stop:2722 length:516 start_codon:yes stop_codon:yes gene_type:complete